jgi:hypothetical protein
MFGEPLHVFCRPGGEVSGDVLYLVLGVVLLGHMQQLLVDLVLADVEAAQRVAQPVHCEVAVRDGCRSCLGQTAASPG